MGQTIDSAFLRTSTCVLSICIACKRSLAFTGDQVKGTYEYGFVLFKETGPNTTLIYCNVHSTSTPCLASMVPLQVRSGTGRQTARSRVN